MVSVVATAPVCNIEDLFPDFVSWEAALLSLQEIIQREDSFEPRANGLDLLSCLQDLDKLQRKQGRLSTYVGVQSFVDARDKQLQTATAKLRESAALLGRRQAVLQALLTNTDESVWAEWCVVAPDLNAYDGRYRSLRSSHPHTFSTDVEQTLAALESTLQLPIQLYRRIKAGDLRFGEVCDSAGKSSTFSLSRYEKRFETSSDAQLRASAAAVFADGAKPHRHAFAAAYAGEISRQVSLARLRGFDTTVDFLFWQQCIERRFFEAQRAVLNIGLPPLMQRFIEVKRRLLNVPKLGYQDLKAYPAQIPADISFERAREAIINASHTLGKDYASVIQQAFDERWIEYGQQPNKADSSGCASPFGPHPYVLMTWSGSPRDMFLLAHELGHAVHFHWSASHQAVLNAAPLRYFIEAPSTLNELLLADYLLRDDDPRQRLSTVFELLNSYYHNFVTHHLESEFQIRVYSETDAGRLPGPDALEKIKIDVLRTFWGDAVDIDDNAGLAWVRQQHYYMGLYPYTYAAGQSIASLYQQRLKSDPHAAECWCAALRQGSSVDAASLLTSLDLDLSNDNAFSSVLNIIEGYVELFEQLAQPYFTNGELA